MISNSKWLNSLSSGELTEWLNAEHEPCMKNDRDAHYDTQNTRSQNAESDDHVSFRGLKLTFAEDSREKIESDADNWLGSWTAFSVPIKTVKQAVVGWLDRQEAITAREVEHDLMIAGRMAVEVERSRISELEAELAKEKTLNAELLDACGDCEQLAIARMETESFRTKVGDMLDAAKEIARIGDLDV